MKKPNTIIIKREDFPKWRIPLPQKTGGVHIPKTGYDRRKDKAALRRETKELLL